MYVELPTPIAQTGKLNLLVDIGAAVTVIDATKLKPSTLYYEEDSLDIVGMEAQKPIKTLGSATVCFSFSSNCKITHQVQ